jgi:hypothetical protein
MPSQIPHHDTTPGVRHVQCLAIRNNQQQHGPLGNSQLLPAKSHVSVPAGEGDSTHVGSSVASAIQGQNSTSISLLNDS